MEDKIKIDNVEYNIIDTIEKMTVPDCFVVSSNTIGKGHGEAKFYIGSRNKSEILDFFGGQGFNVKCFIKKNDLQSYMKEVKDEYFNPEQNYTDKNNFPNLWGERLNKINQLQDIEYFNLIDQIQIQGNRFYVSSDKINTRKFKYKGYQILREISLPNITYLAAIKLKNKDNNILYYLRLFVEYYAETENSVTITEQINKIENSNTTPEEKIQLTKARVGQGQYRQKLLENCPFCPITLVSDDRLLIASHIKPWAKSDSKEKIDPYNGFMFTPNIDFLFDRGFITFTAEKRMLISPWLSKMTCSKLNISPNKKYDMLPIEGREKYLEYHRKEIFKA